MAAEGPSRRTLTTGFSDGCRVCSLTIGKTSISGRSSASASVHPIMSCATGLINVTRPSRSVVITASPMLLITVLKPTDTIPVFSECRRSLNHQYRIGRRVGFHAPADFEPTDIGQVHVEQHELRLQFMGESQRGFPGRRFVYFKTRKP